VENNSINKFFKKVVFKKEQFEVGSNKKIQKKSASI